jgi:hypothetical protein
MKYLLLLMLALLLPAAACGGDDDGSADGLLEELGGVCAQGNADDDHIKVDSPKPGDEVASPLTVEGSIDAFEQQFWISVVTEDGERVIDYPARSQDLEEGTLSPFSVSVPFSSGEDAAACLWVYRQNVEDPEDAVRVPITLLSTQAAENGE